MEILFNLSRRDNIGSYFGKALNAFDLEPSVDLGVMRPGQSLSQLTSRLLTGLEDHFKTSKPDLILAHGDTTTCFATAISSFYHQIPFFHVEAGLRTHRLNSPFPEEFNRQSIAPIARHHFAPTELEQTNLIKDGVSQTNITITGSTVHEAVQIMQKKDRSGHYLNFLPPAGSRPVVVVTLHRREAVQSLQNMLLGLRVAALDRPDALFICPVHPNPSVKEAFRLLLEGLENVVLLEPLEYPHFVSLLMRSSLVVTDSGGVQEEAAFLGKKVLLARTETERDDGFHSGLVKLIGVSAKGVRDSVLSELSYPISALDKKRNSRAHSASEIITDEVQRVVG